MNHEMIFSGFGGQGIMLMGQLCAQAGLEAGKEVSWFPSYGPEMRGGTAFCSIILADEPVGSPVVIDPGIVAAMNQPSLLRFMPSLRPGGTLIINSSLTDMKPDRTDIRIVCVPMNQVAEACGSSKILSSVGLGVVAGACAPVDESAFLLALDALLGKKFAHKPALLELNKKAFLAGCSAGRNLSS